MKKFNIILMLLLMFFVTGCGNKKFDLYQGESDSKYFTGRATERVNVTHYSFMGEHDFTDDEVNHYCKVMDKISNNILSGIYQKN